MEIEEHIYHCPMCGSSELEVIDCRIVGHMPLSDEGFIPQGDTTDEIVLCKFCSHKEKMDAFMDANQEQETITLRELAKEHPELYDFDYKWKTSDKYRDLSQILDALGYELISSEVQPGEYNDIKAYFECQIRKRKDGR